MDDGLALVLGLAVGIAFAVGGVFWYREQWSNAALARATQMGEGRDSLWGHRFGRNAHRAWASIFGLFTFGIIAFCLGALLTEVSLAGASLHAIGDVLTAAGLAAFGATVLIWLSVFAFGRPNFLLPPALRGQPGFFWDRGPLKHAAWVASVTPSGEDRYFSAFC